jgi:hypothetical protein
MEEDDRVERRHANRVGFFGLAVSVVVALVALTVVAALCVLAAYLILTSYSS